MDDMNGVKPVQKYQNNQMYTTASKINGEKKLCRINVWVFWQRTLWTGTTKLRNWRDYTEEIMDRKKHSFGKAEYREKVSK